MRRSLNLRLAGLHARRARRLAGAGRWAEAARAYERALARHGRNRTWWIALADAYGHTRDWRSSARAYEHALALNQRGARVHAKLGRARARAHEWEGAIEAYEAAIARNPLKPSWLAALARARSHVEQWDRPPAVGAEDARAQARLARGRKRERQAAKLARDPGATELDRRLAEASPARLGTRRGIGRFVTPRLDGIRERATAPRPASELGFKVFVYWGQGIESAPSIVRRCADEVGRTHRDGDVLFLDEASVREYAQVPPAVARAVGRDHTRRSDLLRLELLSSHGGAWMDATCLPRARIQDVVPDLLGSGFFAFTYRRARLGNWFLASEPNHYLVAMLREAHYEYWAAYDHVVDYYLFHHLFEVLYHLDERFAALWDATPRLPVSLATAYGKSLLEPHDAEREERLLEGSFVHKLTYKVDAAGVRPESGLARLLS